VSLDETVEESDLNDLLDVFGSSASAVSTMSYLHRSAALKCKVVPCIAVVLCRALQCSASSRLNRGVDGDRFQ